MCCSLEDIVDDDREVSTIGRSVAIEVARVVLLRVTHRTCRCIDEEFCNSSSISTTRPYIKSSVVHAKRSLSHPVEEGNDV